MQVVPIFKKVTEEEFKEFLNKSPRELVRDCSGKGEPPLVSYNDFELADKWPDSMVAKYYAVPGAHDKGYSVCVNFEDVFNTKA